MKSTLDPERVKVLTEAFTRFHCDLPFMFMLHNLTDSEAFQDFVKNLEPGFELPTAEEAARFMFCERLTLQDENVQMQPHAEKPSVKKPSDGNENPRHPKWTDIMESLMCFLMDDKPRDISMLSVTESPSFVAFIRLLDPTFELPLTQELAHILLAFKMMVDSDKPGRDLLHFAKYLRETRPEGEADPVTNVGEAQN